MPKHRLELFTDAVLAIILTIMVLDLKTPNVDGPAALKELGFDLALYALAFLMVAVVWFRHYHYFQRIHNINSALIRANFLLLFLTSLMPLSVRAVAAHPYVPIYAVLGCANVLLIVIAFSGVRYAARGLHTGESDFAAWFRKRNWISFGACVAVIAAGAMAYVSMLITFVIMLLWFGAYFFLS